MWAAWVLDCDWRERQCNIPNTSVFSHTNALLFLSEMTNIRLQKLEKALSQRIIKRCVTCSPPTSLNRVSLTLSTPTRGPTPDCMSHNVVPLPLTAFQHLSCHLSVKSRGKATWPRAYDYTAPNTIMRIYFRNRNPTFALLAFFLVNTRSWGKIWGRNSQSCRCSCTGWWGLKDLRGEALRITLLHWQAERWGNTGAGQRI